MREAPRFAPAAGLPLWENNTGYSHPPNCNGQIRDRFRKLSWRSQTPMLKQGLTERLQSWCSQKCPDPVEIRFD